MTGGTAAIAVPSGLRHSLVEDALGLLTGTFVASLGIFLLTSAHAVTGGTAGLSLLLSYASGLPFGLIYVLVNLPFLAFGLRARGWDFTLRTLLSIAAVSGFASVHPLMLPGASFNPVYATLVGNLLAGIGMLIVFRHRSSLGGLNTLALLVQDRTGWRAGTVQLAVDVVIIAAALPVVGTGTVALSAAGAGVLGVVLTLNHRPGRYLGH